MYSLRIIGIIYFLSGLWCAIYPNLAALGLGLQFSNIMGLVEFLSVYVGLQFGLGVAMILFSMRSKLLISGVLFSFIFSAVLAMTRLLAILIHGANDMMWMLLLLEVLITFILFLNWNKMNRTL